MYNCDYCNKNLGSNQDKIVELYIPELEAVYCEQCTEDYIQKRSMRNEQYDRHETNEVEIETNYYID